MKSAKKTLNPPRLCFVGAMTGNTAGRITQQGQIVAGLFDRAGYAVVAVSPHLNRYRRLLDIVVSLIRNRRQTDIMILEVYGGLSFVVEDIASWLASRFGFPVVMWLHGGSLPEFMTRFPRWTKRVFARANLVVTPSEFLARAVESIEIKPRIIPNVIEVEDYTFRLRRSVKPRLFWMRSFHEIWNPGMAIRVVDRVRRSLPDATLVMAGPDKGTKAETEQLAESRGVAPRVRFAGFLDREGKAREANQADIFINTNRIDNMPVAIIEAGAMGLPVVSTRVGGIPDLLTDRHNALLVPDNDDAAMAEAIVELTGNPDLAARLSRNGRELAEQFSWDRVRPQWEKVFAQLLNRADEAALPLGEQAKHLGEPSRVNPAMMEIS